MLAHFNGIQARHRDVEMHLILVNDGSTRGVKPNDIQLLKENLVCFSYLSYEKNQGKGFALRSGLKISQSLFCLYTDIDFPYTQESMSRMIKCLQNGKADVLVGVREANYYAQVPPIRIKISKVLKRLTKYLLHLSITDTQCGLKGFNHKGKHVFLKTTINRYLFDLEFIYKAAKVATGLTIHPLYVVLKPEVEFSKMSTAILLQESYSFLKILSRSMWDKFLTTRDI